MSGTERSKDLSQTRSLRPEDAEAPGGRFYVLVVQDGGSSLFHLPRSGAVLVGRAPESDLLVQSDAISRRHARIVVADGEARVVDLDSHNGTLVNGELVDGARSLESGDVITLGDVTLVLHAERRPKARRLSEPAELQRRLEEEIDRTVQYHRPLSVLSLTLGGGPAPLSASAAQGPGGGALAAALDKELRLIDVAAYRDGAVTVLLPELGPEAAERAAAGILAAVLPQHPQARAGLALCPGDGCDAVTLLGAARAAAAQAAPGGLRAAADTATLLTLGDRRVVLADAAMIRLYELIRRLAQSELPVLIAGETGAGKENAAFAVHHFSPRAARPFVAVNCAAIAETLVESELFGHERGAFSGAVAQKIGLLESAAGGTVFLDEVGELSLSVQAKLLRALESRRITRVGDVRERDIELRVVAATNRDLEVEVAAGRFRRDLYFRLSAATVVLPPLRERPREIPLLSRTFLDAACARAGRPAMTLSPATLGALCRYGFPGNVRELKNVMDYAAAAVAEDVVEPWHLPDRIVPSLAQAEEGPPPPPEAAPSAATPAPRSFRPIAEELRELERRRMTEALAATGGVQTRAAELIGMPLRTFVFKLKQYGLGGR